MACRIRVVVEMSIKLCACAADAPNTDSAATPVRSNFSPVARWLQWQTRPPVEEEFALDHGETATTPNRAAKVIFDAEWVTRGDGDADIIALPDLLPGPEARQRWIAFIGGVRHRCTKHRQRSDTG
jgi:hypothetical protein